MSDSASPASASPASANPAAGTIPAPGARRNVHLALTVNGEAREVSFAPYKTLLEVLREDLGLTGTKHGCELGECGACAVLLDGEPVLSCLVLARRVRGPRDRRRSRGWRADAELHPLQEAFADLGAAQCGYCTPGILMTAKALLDARARPEPRADPRGAVGQPLPLHRLPADLRGGRGGGARGVASAQGASASDERASARPLRRHRQAAPARRRPRQGDRADALRRRPRRCRACCTASCCARRIRTRGSSRIDAVARAGASRRAPGAHRRGLPDPLRHPAGAARTSTRSAASGCASSATRSPRWSRATSRPPREALELIDVDYEPLRDDRRRPRRRWRTPSRASTTTATRATSTSAQSFEFGDVDEALAEADHVFEDLFFFEGNTHLPMEQHAVARRGRRATAS